jgi:hypothetical protein
MRVRVQDAAALQTIKPLEVAAYLRANGWQREAEFDRHGSVWVKMLPTGERDLLLPLRQDLADFPTRMAEVLSIIAAVEGRSELEVLQDVATTAADLIRVRALGVVAADGTLPLEQGVAFVEHSRNLVLSAACAAIEKRAFFAKRKPVQAMQYVERSHSSGK